jgi:hypothetical protein
MLLPVPVHTHFAVVVFVVIVVAGRQLVAAVVRGMGTAAIASLGAARQQHRQAGGG